MRSLIEASCWAGLEECEPPTACVRFSPWVTQSAPCIEGSELGCSPWPGPSHHPADLPELARLQTRRGWGWEWESVYKQCSVSTHVNQGKRRPRGSKSPLDLRTKWLPTADLKRSYLKVSAKIREQVWDVGYQTKK